MPICSEYQKKLEAAGVRTKLALIKGAVHSFFSLPGRSFDSTQPSLSYFISSRGLSRIMCAIGRRRERVYGNAIKDRERENSVSLRNKIAISVIFISMLFNIFSSISDRDRSKCTKRDTCDEIRNRQTNKQRNKQTKKRRYKEKEILSFVAELLSAASINQHIHM